MDRLVDRQALDEASKTIKGITGLEVNVMTAKVDPDSGKISQYTVGVKNSVQRKAR